MLDNFRKPVIFRAKYELLGEGGCYEKGHLDYGLCRRTIVSRLRNTYGNHSRKLACPAWRHIRRVDSWFLFFLESGDLQRAKGIRVSASMDRQAQRGCLKVRVLHLVSFECK